MFDVAIIGAGMAGASVAAELSPYCSVIMLEREAQPGYHATGRSAAFWDECYGGPLVQPLTRASHAFLFDPPADFASGTLLHQRGVLYLGREGEIGDLEAHVASFGDRVKLEMLDRSALLRRITGLKPEWVAGVFGGDCSDIDVGALHSGYLRVAKRYGAQLRCDANVVALGYVGDHWQVDLGDTKVEARILVNAAGAWADPVATLAGANPLGLQPYRRTVVQLRTDPKASPDLPLVIHIGGEFYFKPETSGQLWASPHDETPSPPCDAAPEELDVAIAIHAYSQAVDCTIEAVTHRWAGLRTFSPDRLPVYGFDPLVPGFFWCAGQGGFGIQTAPAAAKLCAALIREKPTGLELAGIEAERYSPARFATAPISAL